MVYLVILKNGCILRDLTTLQKEHDFKKQNLTSSDVCAFVRASTVRLLLRLGLHMLTASLMLHSIK